MCLWFALYLWVSVWKHRFCYNNFFRKKISAFGMNISEFCFFNVISFLIFYFVYKSVGDGAKCQAWCAFCLAPILFQFLSHIYTLPAVHFQSAFLVDLYCLCFVLNIQDFCFKSHRKLHRCIRVTEVWLSQSGSKEPGRADGRPLGKSHGEG